VLEVGPGHGELSDLLVPAVARLALVEKDDRLAADLEERYAGHPHVTVVNGDALEIELDSLLGTKRPGRLISNVPYAITTPLVFRFLDIRPLPARLVLLVQREVADRICASAGSRAYGALSVGVQVRASARVAFKVGRKAFRPVPAVESAVVVLEPGPPDLSNRDVEALRSLTRASFSRRRKQMATVLRTAPEYGLTRETADAVLDDLGIAPKARPETLTPALFVALARRLGEF
jgi:16S rRNA (adenine1518-N6/adenine1519-N6)-dimethyltransferase